MIAATIFLCVFVILGGVVLYLSRTIDHGEARFDSETGKVKRDEPEEDRGPTRPATRIENTDDNS